jgi:DNA invertase Pin-like site-specific DNA recombinase
MVDIIVFARLDCVAGSLREPVQVFDVVRRCRVALASVEEQIDTSRDGGDLVFHVMRAVGQFERRCHGERIRLGLARARVGGTRLDRPPADVNPADVVRLRDQGLSYRQVGRRLGISAALAHRLARAASRDGPRAV